MTNLKKHDPESYEDGALLTMIAEKGMEAFEKMIDKNAATERHKVDMQKEIAFKRIEATERIKNKENAIGGISMAVLLGVFVWLSVTEQLNVGNASILGAALAGAIGKFLGLSLPKRNDPN